jgi:hypothetical protein
VNSTSNPKLDITQDTSTVTLKPIEEKASCIGEITPSIPGLSEVKDSLLLADALGEPLKGKLCKAKVYQVDSAVTVYRVWDKNKDYTIHGRWWSMTLPQGPKEEYRIKNDICPEWSKLNVMSSCTVLKDSKIVIGPDQSAQCKNSVLPASAINQVYIPNDSRNNVLFVKDCTQGQAWPKKIE